jgi:hypothetical protein
MFVPSLATAQAISGTVTDTTGAVLPGVTVEARSPALIERVRTAVTDASGQYRIVALERGVYSVTFTLAGFSTLVREGIELTTGFTANVDVQLLVGALEETVTVTQVSPIVDVQSIRQSKNVSREIYEGLPTARTYDSLALLVPAMNIQGGATTSLSVDTAAIGGESRNRLSIHGSDQADGEVMLNGMDIMTPSFDGAPHGSPFDTAIAEYVYDYSGHAAEVQTGGVRLNMIPKAGGNVFHGGFFADFAHSSWLANNVDQELIDRGITGGKNGGVKLDQVWYVAPSLGGPIVRDRLWFFGTYSFRRGSLFPANFFNNTDTSSLVYVPDLSKPTKDRKNISEATQHLTWQVTSKDKVQVYTVLPGNLRTQIPALSGSQAATLFSAPEAGLENEAWVNTYQLTWARPQTNQILFEAGIGLQPVSNDWFPLDSATQRARGTGREDLNARIDLPGVFESTTLTASRNRGFVSGGTDFYYSTTNSNVRASMSYVTGTHNLKVGVQFNEKWQHLSHRSGNNWTNMITFRGSPIVARFSAKPSVIDESRDVGIYVQEQWTVDRLTVNGGVRFDYFKAGYPDQVAEPMTWAPVPRPFPGATVVSWKDLQPRMGVVYDLRGDGRTALKAVASRYGDRNTVSVSSQVNPLANNILMSRSWFDGGNPFGIPGLPACIGPVECRAGDGLVQGDPLNPLPNGEITSPNTTPEFATPEITQFYDPDWAFGWGKKAANWEFSGSVQHELIRGVSVDLGYFRRTYVKFSAVDDRSNDPEDWDRYTIIVPNDPRLPNGGGFPLTLVDLNPAAVAKSDRITRRADIFGGRSQMWHGFDLNLSARVRRVLLNGGYATGKETNDRCALQTALPETINASAGSGQTVVPLEHCVTETPWISQASIFGSYRFPYAIEVSAAFFSREGTPRLAIYTVPLPVATAALARTPTATSITVNVVEPGTSYGDRLNQLDLRIAKMLNFGGGLNLRASFEIYNVFNGNAVGREQYGLANYLQPVGLQPGRLAKVSFQLNF